MKNILVINRQTFKTIEGFIDPANGRTIDMGEVLALSLSDVSGEHNMNDPELMTACNRCALFMRQAFDDVVNLRDEGFDVDGTDGENLITPEQGEEIADFIAFFEDSDIDWMVIHCNAGLSRSVAVAQVMKDRGHNVILRGAGKDFKAANVTVRKAVEATL